MKKWLIILIIVALIAGGGFFGYQRIMTQRAAAESPPLETAIVRRGDLIVAVEATGSLASPTKYTLAFSTAGKVSEVMVAEGQSVKKDDLLARLEDNIQAEADFQALFTDAGIAETELAAVNAQEALVDAIDNLKYIIGSDTYYWETQLKEAEETLAAFNDDSNASAEQKAEAQVLVDEALRHRNYFLNKNIDDLEDDDGYYVDDSDIALSRSNLEDAKILLQDAETALEIVKVGPLGLQTPLATLGPEMERLEETRLKAESTRLTAPINSVVTKVYYQAEEFANIGTPVIALSDVSVLEIETNLDETDVARIEVGNPVVITLDAFSGVELNGSVESIAPIAVVESGVVLYPITISLDGMTDVFLRSGMTTNVSILVENRKETLLVPLRAIETEGEQAYIWRVTPEGSERIEITLGLLTDTEAEILSGLAEGDEVVVYAAPEDRANVEYEGLRGVFGGD